MSIEIHLHGKPSSVSPLQAAREVANLNTDFEYHGIRIGEPGEDGWISHGYVTVSGRSYRYGKMQPPEISWGAWGEVSIADARQQAEQIALAVQIAELAEMIAAEQSGQARTQCADCDQPLDGRELACISAGCPSRPAGPARISEAAIDKAMAATLGLCPASTVMEDDERLYCDKQLGEDGCHAGNHHAEIGDGGEVAWGDESDPRIRKGSLLAHPPRYVPPGTGEMCFVYQLACGCELPPVQIVLADGTRGWCANGHGETVITGAAGQVVR